MTFNKKRASEEDFPEMPFRSPQVLTRSFSSTVAEIYLDGEISSPDKYREAYHILSNAGPNDYIVIHVNSPGGRLDAGIQIINHIKQCKAKVVGVLHMECSSMASGILLACDEWELNSFSTMMVHSCSYGAGGKQSDIHTRVDFMTKFNEKFIREQYTGFLSEEEIVRVLKGDDLYFDSDEIKERLEVFQEYREEKELEEKKRQAEELEAKLEQAQKVKAAIDKINAEDVPVKKRTQKVTQKPKATKEKGA